MFKHIFRWSVSEYTEGITGVLKFDSDRIKDVFIGAICLCINWEVSQSFTKRGLFVFFSPGLF